MVTKDTRLIVAEDLSIADLAGEAVVLDAKSGQYYGLNELGARIFGLMDQPRRVGEIMEVIQDEYDVDESQLKSDLTAVVQQARLRGFRALAPSRPRCCP
mgnify:CR=1 FL=1